MYNYMMKTYVNKKLAGKNLIVMNVIPVELIVFVYRERLIT